VPYALKLLIHELQVMNVQMRIITDENIDQLMSMSYSNNPSILLNSKDDLEQSIKEYSYLVHQITRKVAVVNKIEEDTGDSDIFAGIDVLKITVNQKLYKLDESDTGEGTETPVLTQEMMDDPKITFYKTIILPDGREQSITKYSPPYDIISLLSKSDQQWIIQQPMKIQFKILKEIADKQAYQLLRQRDRFLQGKEQTPFLKNTPDQESDAYSPPYNPNATESPAYASASPAYVPSYNSNATESSSYASASPAYNPNAQASSPYSPPYNPNATESSSLTPAPGSKELMKTDITADAKEKPKTILDVEESKVTPEKSDEKPGEPSDNKIITITGPGSPDDITK